MKKAIIIIAVVIIALLGVWGYLRFVVGGPEDSWICEGGQWVKHGQPSSPAPTTPCGKQANTNTANVNKNVNKELNTNQAGIVNEVETPLDPQMFQWSTMSQGPYRDKITYATGADLFSWTPSGNILAEHASVPGAVVKDGTIFVYFVDVSQNGVKEQLGMVKSTDNGQTWSTPANLTIAGLGNKATADPAPVLLTDGRIRLFYFDINEMRLSKSGASSLPTNKIYSAISSDGVSFTQEEGVRFERTGVFDPDVEYVNGRWLMYTGDIEGNKVIVATSTDGLTFTEAGTAYQGGAVPDVFYKNGTYYLYTAGIGIATSADGQQFTDANKRFSDQNYRITADPSVVQLNDAAYLMFYKVQP